MFSPDNFYKYLSHRFSQSPLAVEPYYFTDPGNRDITGINIFGHRPNLMPARYASRCLLADQEPLDSIHYLNWIHSNLNNAFVPEAVPFATSLKPMEFVSYFLSGLHTPILCHSERNSEDVEAFREHFFSPVHYFYHGLIARDWFRHWKHYNIQVPSKCKRLGLYARAASGTREYRLDLLNQLIPYKEQIYYRMQPEIADLLPATVRRNWQFNNVARGPASSAIIDLEDAGRFQIQLVPETLFATSKTHLTEKVFKPVVMKQPFIVVGPPNSLTYLKHYGFKTFDGLWDESYDAECDADIRMNKIIDVVKHLTSMDSSAFNRLLEKSQNIVEFNHRHFFGQAFEDQMLNELHQNLNSAVEEVGEKFRSNPGGNWFYYQTQLIQQGLQLPESTRRLNRDLVKYVHRLGQSNISAYLSSTYQHLF